MRKFIALIAVLGLAACFAGCGGDADGKTIKDKDTGLDVTKPLDGPSQDDAPMPEGDGTE